MYRVIVEEKQKDGTWKEVKEARQDETPGLLCMSLTTNRKEMHASIIGLSPADIATMLFHCKEARDAMKVCMPLLPLADALLGKEKEDLPAAIDAEAMLVKLDKNSGGGVQKS